LRAVKLADFVRELRWREVFLELGDMRREQRNDAVSFG
jgi:hypothetical protein